MEHVRINGVELAYAIRGSGAPLVMVHGAQGDQTMFAGLASAATPGTVTGTFARGEKVAAAGGARSLAASFAE